MDFCWSWRTEVGIRGLVLPLRLTGEGMPQFNRATGLVDQGLLLYHHMLHVLIRHVVACKLAVDK